MIDKDLLADEIRHRAKLDPLMMHELMPLQKAFEESGSKKKVAFGGNRAGKSELGARYVLKKARNNPGMRIWVAGVTFNDSVNIQQRKIFVI